MSDDLSQQPDEKKLHVDEDWKSQVQAEKEAAPQTDPGSDESSQAPTAEAADAAPHSDEPEDALPTPTLNDMIIMFSTQAYVALGLMPHPATGQSNCRLPESKYFIDLLALLQQKTEGNRDEEESKVLDDLLHELRMTFLAVSKQAEA